ncbi:MAG: hypothetical protein M4579_004849 [Chaenotheca gracillima]|nr:MAG: hypothetical protein M4579_004849 [Chaenotheca gracillima]
MNNSQFRRLVLDTPARNSNEHARNGSEQTPRGGAGSPASLGSKMRSNIPMTPRSLKGSAPHHDFARQLAERNDPANASASTRRFRSSAAPKGTKLPTGYVDRARDRAGADEEDRTAQEESLAARVQALEEMMKLGQIDQATFEKTRDQIVGGDLSSTHLVKGLDFKLLERVRRGEDVFGSPSESDDHGTETQEKDVDVDEELDRLEGEEVAPVVKEKVEKKGEMAPPPAPISGKKRTRDEILAELRASRQAAATEKAAAAQPALGPKFRRFGEKQEKSRIERDAKGREVLITVDEQGRVKRKIRRNPVAEQSIKGENSNGLLMPDAAAAPLGMEVPAGLDTADQPVEEEEGDIFEGVGEDYDPLAGMEGDSSSEEEGEAHDDAPKEGSAAMSPPRSPAEAASESPRSSIEPSVRSTAPPAKRNYFGLSSSSPESEAPQNPLSDPTILAALRNSSSKKVDSASGVDNSDDGDEAVQRRARMMASLNDRDDEDIDLGFGSSRFDDEDEEADGKRIKLSVWQGEDGDNDSHGGKGGPKRKRGGKKKRGDKDSAADVMKVIEGRKASGKG